MSCSGTLVKALSILVPVAAIAATVVAARRSRVTSACRHEAVLLEVQALSAKVNLVRRDVARAVSRTDRVAAQVTHIAVQVGPLAAEVASAKAEVASAKAERASTKAEVAKLRKSGNSIAVLSLLSAIPLNLAASAIQPIALFWQTPDPRPPAVEAPAQRIPGRADRIVSPSPSPRLSPTDASPVVVPLRSVPVPPGTR